MRGLKTSLSVTCHSLGRQLLTAKGDLNDSVTQCLVSELFFFLEFQFLLVQLYMKASK